MNNPALGLRKKHSSAGHKAGAQPQAVTQTGPIAGPGTGTSDSIPTAVDEGTYILPADTTAAVGLGIKPKVPAKVSNGEYQIAPEDVYELGRQVLDKVRDATHAQVPERNGPIGSFANGGAVFSGTDPDELGRNNTPKRPVINAPDPMYVDSKGNTTKAMPSQSRALVPVNAPNTLPATVPQAPQAGMRPNAGTNSNTFYGNSQGAVNQGSMPSSSKAVVPTGQPQSVGSASRALVPVSGAAPNADSASTKPAGVREPDYRARAETMARAKADSAAYEADRAARASQFSPAGGQPQPDAATQAKPKMGMAGKALGGLGLGLSLADEGQKVYQVAADANTNGYDVATQVAEGAGRLGAAGAGAALGAKGGAALGLMAGPFAPVASPVLGAVGAIGGGVLGYFGADKAIKAGRAATGVDTASPVDRVAPQQQAPNQAPSSTGSTDIMPAAQAQASDTEPPSEWTSLDYGGIAMRQQEGQAPEFSNSAESLAGARTMPAGGVGAVGGGRGSLNITPTLQNVANGAGGRAGGGIRFSGTTGGDENAMDRAARRREFAIAGGLRNPSQRSLRDLEQASINRQELGLKRQESAQNAERQAQTDASRMALEQAQTEQAQTNSALARTDLSGKQRLDSLIQAMSDPAASEEDRALARSTYTALTTQAKDRYLLQDEQIGVDALGVPKYGKVAYDVTTRQRLGGQSSGQQSSFEKGKVYKNANGERARYSGTDASGNPIWEQV